MCTHLRGSQKLSFTGNCGDYLKRPPIPPSPELQWNIRRKSGKGKLKDHCILLEKQNGSH